MRILIVEDEAKLAADLSSSLEAAGYATTIAEDGEEAWFLAETEAFSAIILDLGLPQLDGLSVLKRLRAAGSNTPVLILTARGTWAERVEGIDAGADDYLPKPFQMEELLARLRAILRRAVGIAQPVLQIGPMTVDPKQMRVSVDGRAAALSQLEYRAVAYLAHHCGRVVPPAELTEHVYGGDDRSDNSLEALVSRIRRKLGAPLIETRRGYGYMIACDPPSRAPETAPK